jgi:penicillin amidase
VVAVKRLLLRLAAVIASLIGAMLLIALGYVGYVAFETAHAVARVDGSFEKIGVLAPVTIARDARGIPHIRAANEHDLYFAQGFAEGSDRLFQMDLLRHYVDGRLSEWIGKAGLASDIEHRRFGVARMAHDAYVHASDRERDDVDAFTEGVNAAAAAQPLPPEYRALFLSFEAWKPSDAYADGFATALELVDDGTQIGWRDLILGDLGPNGLDAFYPQGDPKYDAPAMGGKPLTIPPLPPLTLRRPAAPVATRDERATIGSNAWAVGGAHVVGGRAVLANDPHLRLQIPGVWYLFEAEAPGLHIAGASLAGTPGVVLGHNEHIAWGVTNGGTAAMRLWRQEFQADGTYFTGTTQMHTRGRHELMHVRFGADVERVFQETDRGVVLQDGPGVSFVLDWEQMQHPRSPLAAFDALDRAPSIDAAMDALRAYPGPVQNFVFADDRGRAAYRLGGPVLEDGDYALRPLDGLPRTGPPKPATIVPFARMPAVEPSRDAVVVTANNRPFSAGYPYRLAAGFAPPYRAYEIATHLRGRAPLTPDAVGAAAFDLTSPAERELCAEALAAAAHVRGAPADLVAALRTFDGRIAPDSTGATAIVAVRRAALAMLVADHLPPADAAAYLGGDEPALMVLVRALRERPRGWVPGDDYDAFLVAAMQRARSEIKADAVPAFGTYGGWTVAHPLAMVGFSVWNGPHFAGHGGSYAPAVQWNGHSQSFRALWIPGDWDAGGIDIPSGESGEPGSEHYRDLGARWERNERTPLPFSDAAVAKAAVHALTLTP